MDQLTIAIDGPASSGKSTVAKRIAEELSLVYIDTGAMYRAVTNEVIEQGVSLENEKEIVQIARNTEIAFEAASDGQKVFSNGSDVTDVIREPEVTNAVSQVSAYPGVRAELVRQQREMAKSKGVVMDGRDIGTVVLPEAKVKVFLVASVEARARRRFDENRSKGILTPLKILTEEIEARDYKDSHRASSPLLKAYDAILLDTTELSIEEVVEAIHKIIETAEKR